MEKLIKELRKHFTGIRVNTAKDMVTRDGKFFCWLSENEIKRWLARVNE